MTPFVPDLPRTLSAAMRRGIVGKCPRCGGTHLFRAFLKPVDRCGLCGQDWTLHAADDFPPYVSIIVTGHVMAPFLIILGAMTAISLWLTLSVAVVMAVAMLMGLLQPAKGGIIALQWWMGMAGFAGRSGKAEAAANAPGIG